MSKVVDGFNRSLDELDLTSAALGDQVQELYNLLSGVIKQYIDMYAPKSVKPTLKSALKVLDGAVKKPIQSLNGTDVSKYSKQIKSLHDAAKTFSVALGMAQMFGAK